MQLVKNVIKAASTTQAVIALLSGALESYAIVRGTATAVGMKSMARESGQGCIGEKQRFGKSQ